MSIGTTDEDLALAAAGGDGEAFALLLSRVYDRLFALCFRLVGARAEAEDLTQDICLALPAKLATYRRHSRVTTWLYRIAVNAAHDRRRRRATYMKAADGWGDWEIDRTEAGAAARERLDWLTEAMRNLPEDLRDTLALVLDDLTHAEAGEILGISEGAVSWRLSEVRRRLRALRQKEEAE